MSDGSSRPPIRITIDTNLLVSGLIRTGTPPNQLLRAWIRGAIRLAMSAEMRAEVADVLQRPKFAHYHIDAKLMADVRDALAVSVPVEPPAGVDLPLRCRDAKDDTVLACALAAKVDYIVTGDEDLHAPADHPALGSTRIVSARALLVRLSLDPDDQQHGPTLTP